VRDWIADLAHSFRLLWRQPGFTVAAILLLALGIGLTAGIFSVVNTVLLKPLPFNDSDRLCYVWTRCDAKGRKQSAFSAAEFLDYRSQIRSFAGFSAFRHYRATWTDKGVTSRVSTVLLTQGYFDVLGVQPALGRGFAQADFEPGGNTVVLVSHAFWTERLGRDPDVLGKPVVLDSEPHTVIGVLPAIQSDFMSSEVYVPVVFSSIELATRDSRYLYALARLKPDVSLQRAQSELNAAAKNVAERHPDSNSGWSAYLVEAKEEIIGESRTPILVLFAAVCLVLLIACANLANLFLVRISGRQRDIAVRSALGASQTQIVRQLLFESIWIAGMGGAAGLAVAYATLKAVVTFSPAAVPRLENAALDPPVTLFTAGLSLFSGLIFGIAPALRSMSLNLANSLRDESRSSTGGKSRSRARNVLVVAEVALSVILLICAGLLTRTFQKLAAIDLGFSPSGVLTARTALPDPKYRDEAPRAEYARRALEKLRAIPGVQAAGVGTALPMQQVNWMADFHVEGRDATGGQAISVGYHAVSPGFLEAIGTPLKKGRGFNEGDSPEASRVVIVNEEFERVHLAGLPAIGQALRVRVGKHDFRAEIVGVVGTVRQLRPDEQPRPAIYQPHAQNPWPFLAFAVRTRAGEAAVGGAIRQAFTSVDPDLPMDRILPLSNLLGNTMRQKKLAFGLLILFGGLAVALSLIGLYSVLAISVTQRRRELGIRMALGARRGDLTGLVVRQGGLLAAAGLIAGFVVAPLAGRALESMLVGVTPADPITYAGVAALILGASLLASFVPAWRGANVDPLEALRDS
jgi:putative ABC transport system permease protein